MSNYSPLLPTTPNFYRPIITITFLFWTLSIALIRPIAAEISGTIHYDGVQSGPLHVSAMHVRPDNQVLSLDGHGDYAFTPTLIDLSGSEISIQFWFRGSFLHSAVRQQSWQGVHPDFIVAGFGLLHILSFDGGTHNGISSGLPGIPFSDLPTYPVDNWQHFTMTWKRNTQNNGFSSFLDGRLVESKGSTDTVIPNLRAPVHFGSSRGIEDFACGQLDEIAIWDRALTEEEVLNSWLHPLVGDETGLIGLWNFDDGTGKDLVAGNDAVLRGDALIEPETENIPALVNSVKATLEVPGPYQISQVLLGDHVKVNAFMDVNGNQEPDVNEPQGIYADSPFVLAANVFDIDIELQEKPRVIKHPTSQRLKAGDPVSLKVEALGTAPLQWQWRHNGLNLADNDRVSGVNTRELIIENSIAADSGVYDCLISNGVGETFSEAAKLRIIEGGLTVSGAINYDGVQSGPIHVSVTHLRPDNQVLSLDGNGDYAITPLTDLSGSEISIQFWFRGSSVQSAVRQQDGRNYIVAGWNGRHILSFDGGHNGMSAGGASVTDGNWHQLTMTWKGNIPQNGFRSFLDGRLIESRNCANTDIPNLEAPVYFGSWNGILEFANGQLDEIAIWDRALTLTEILDDWNASLVGDENGLIGYWNFDDGSGKDLVAGNDAVLQGDALIETENIPGFVNSVFKATLEAPGPYQISQMPLGDHVEVKAFMDLNDNQEPDENEPQGDYADNPFALAHDVSDIDLTLAVSPTLVVQPDDVRAKSGSPTVEFQAQALGTPPLSWQWYRNEIELADNAKFKGTDSATLTVESPTAEESGNYSVRVSNSRGTDSSRVAQLEFVTGQTATLSGNLYYSDTPPGMIHVTAAQFFSENRALKLDGDGDTVVIPNWSSLFRHEITIQYWYRGKTFRSAVSQQIANSDYIVTGSSVQHLHILSNDGGMTGIAAGPGITNGTWNHLTMTWKIDTPNGFRSYLNGRPVALRDSSSMELPFTLFGEPLYFGSLNGNSEFLEGELDEIAIWDRALTEEEIRTGWNARLTGAENKLQGLWKFDSDTPHDSSTSKYEGELHGDAEIVPAEIPGFGGVVYTDVFAASGPFAMPNLPQGDGYRLSAFVDLNGNYHQDPDEPAVGWSETAINLDRDLSDFTLYLDEMP